MKAWVRTKKRERERKLGEANEPNLPRHRCPLSSALIPAGIKLHTGKSDPPKGQDLDCRVASEHRGHETGALDKLFDDPANSDDDIPFVISPPPPIRSLFGSSRKG